MTDRIARARSAMRSQGVDLLAVAPSDDLRYLLGFSPTADERPCMLFVGADRELFVVPSLNAEQARAAVPDVELSTWADEEGADSALGAAVAALGRPRRVAVDATMRADFLLLLRRFVTDAELTTATAVVGELRLRKDAAELEALEASARTADTAIEASLAACAAGARELEIAEAAASGFRRAGCEEVLFTSVASGPNGAFPHHHSSSRALQPGDGVTIDIGGRLAGYPSDLTRTAHVGEPSERYARVHAVVEEAVQAGIAAARPGATCGSVDLAAREVIAAAGFGEYFVHRTGHGLGVSGHEPPWIMAGDERRLEPGMVFSIEPGIYVPNELGVRLEEIVVLEEDRARILSALPRDLKIV
jgi:Xaa-Pro aminopeptidase